MNGRVWLVISTLFLASFGDTTIVEQKAEEHGDKERSASRPQQCGRFYNNGQHRQWAECMGVGYKTDEVSHE